MLLKVKKEQLRLGYAVLDVLKKKKAAYCMHCVFNAERKKNLNF